MNLYQYQIENKESIQEQWEKYPAVLYQLPTGGGKTVVINSIIEDLENKKIIILVHRIEIILQIRDRLRARGIDCGVIAGNIEDNINSDVLIGSILTVARDKRLDNILDKNFDYMIIDEAHHACSDSYLKVISKFKRHNLDYKLLGVSATPYRKDKRSLAKVFDVMVKGPTYSWLRANGYLAGYKCYPVKLNDLDEVELSGGDYKISDLSRFMRSDKLIDLAINSYKKRGDNKQMLVFCVDIKHAVQVKEAYINEGFDKIAIIDSNTPDEERREINKGFRDGTIQIIVSIQTLTEGVDLPETKVIQLLRPTLSLVLYLQILGRGTRLKSDNSDLIILDCSNNTFTHGLLDSDYVWSLEDTEPNPLKDDRKIVGKKRGGTRILDEEEIGLEFEEVEEISHNEFLSIHTNGIDIAKKENDEKNQKILKKIIELEDILNKKSKNKKINFSFKTSDFISYNLFNNFYVFNDKQDEVCKIIIESPDPSGDMKFSFKTDYLSAWKLDYKSIYMWEYLGIFQKFFNEDIQNLFKKYYKEVYLIKDSFIDINLMESELKEKKREQDEINISENLKKGNYLFKLIESKYCNYLSNRTYGQMNAIRFDENPNKFKANNRVTLILEGREKFTLNVSKEKLLDVLSENWEVQL